MKTLAFASGLCIAEVGAVGIVVPASLVWIAQYFVTSGAFVALAAVRIVLGLILISVAPTSRAPTGLRILGYVIVTLGMMETGRARTAIDWWWHQGSGIVRLTSSLVLALGSFIAYACAPAATVPAALPDRGLKLTGRLGAGAPSRAKSPEWKFVREGPAWHGRRVAPRAELFV